MMSNDPRRIAVAILVAVLGAFACGGSSGRPARLTVTTLADSTGSSACSLRDAISFANGSPVGGSGCNKAAASADTIIFQQGLNGTITLASTLPTITGAVAIEGPTDGNAIAISGGRSVRVLAVASGAALLVQNLTIADGESPDGGSGVSNAGTLTIERCALRNNRSTLNGGAILNMNNGVLEILDSVLADNGTSSVGGAIRSLGGSVTIVDSTVSGNSNGDGGGGAINASGTLTIEGCTFSGNSSSGTGGALNVSGPTSIVNSTFANNTANAPGGAIIAGGVQAEVEITASTFSGNSSAQFAGSSVFAGDSSRISFKGTILARAEGVFTPNCGTGVNSEIVNAGFNIADDASCNFGTSMGASGQTIGDRVDPLLDPDGLQNNGGPTATIALEDDSPAIAAIPVADCTDQDGEPLTTDQRGEPRPDNAPCAIGAYEPD